MKISYYNNFTDNKTKLKEATEVFSSVSSNLLKEQIIKIRGMVKDSPEQKEAKRQLPLVGFRCQMLPTRTTKAPTLIATGLVDIDFDDIPDPEALKDKLAKNPYAHFIFFSPRMGVKVIVRHDNLSTDNEVFKQFYQQVREHFNQYAITDSAVCSIASCCALSWDPDAYHNPDSRVFHFDSSKVVVKQNKVTAKNKTPSSIHNKQPFWLDIDKAYDEIEELYQHFDFTPGHRNSNLNKMAYISATKGIDPQHLKVFVMGKILAPDFDENEIWRTIMSAYNSVFP